MWTPQVIFCIAAYCWIASGAPMPTEEACITHANEVMVPGILAAPAVITILDARCQAPGEAL
jgi:hypothetical protein